MVTSGRALLVSFLVFFRDRYLTARLGRDGLLKSALAYGKLLLCAWILLFCEGIPDCPFNSRIRQQDLEFFQPETSRGSLFLPIRLPKAPL
jgi:hypothetical protein